MFWNEAIWLPPNMTWADVTPVPGSNRYTKFGELWYPIPAAVIIIFVRAQVMRRWFRPLGLYLGIKPSSHKKPPTNEVLELEFQAMKTDKKFIPDTAGLSARLGLTERQIQHWLRRRKLHGITTPTMTWSQVSGGTTWWSSHSTGPSPSPSSQMSGGKTSSRCSFIISQPLLCYHSHGHVILPDVELWFLLFMTSLIYSWSWPRCSTTPS